MSDKNTDHPSDETRAKIAALTHKIKGLAAELPDMRSDTFYGQLEEWHDYYRHLDGADVCDRVDYDVTFAPIPKAKSDSARSEEP